MQGITQEDLELLAKEIPDMSGVERHVFNGNVLDWWLDNQKINPQRYAERSIDLSAGEGAGTDFWDKSSTIDFEVVWKAIADTTKSFNPESGYAYTQQLRNLLRIRNYRNAEVAGMIPARVIRTIRRFRNAIDDYNATAMERISEKDVPDWFLIEYIKTLPEKSRLSLKSFKQILQNTAQSALPIGFSSDEDDEEGAFNIDPPAKTVSLENTVVFTIFLEDMFAYVVREGGIKKKVVFEKINANVVFSCEAAGEGYNIRTFWGFVDHDYAAFFDKNSYEPTDTTIVFHHWFYSDDIPAYTLDLSSTDEWKAKKVNFSITYKKKYKELYNDFLAQ